MPLGFFARLFSGSSAKIEAVPAPERNPEHAVLVHLVLSDDELGTEEEREAIYLLSDRLEEAIERHQAGEFDGNEFGGGGCVLFMYGPDADALFSSIEPIIRLSPLTRDGYAIKRYGEVDDENAREVRVDL